MPCPPAGPGARAPSRTPRASPARARSSCARATPELVLRSQPLEVLQRLPEIASRLSFVLLLELDSGIEVRSAHELLQDRGSPRPEHFVGNPRVLAANLRFIFPEPRRLRA